jgi:Cu+-exporting ATPase
VQDVDLSIGGMTCASCAARVEKKLNKLDGVTATVNYATEKARVHFAEDVTVAKLVQRPSATPPRSRVRTSRTTPPRCAPDSW